MRRTLEQAKADLAAAGYVGEPTPEILRQYGWEPSDDTKAVLAVELNAPARSPDQVKDDLALLYEEAKQNQVPAQILDKIAKFGKTAIGLL